MEKRADYLEERQGTVGISLEIKPAPPLDMKVYCESEGTGIDGKKLTFSVKAYDETGLIGEGTHERFIVHNEKCKKSK